MKKIILTIVLCSVLPAIAVAEGKKMQNSNISTSDVDMAGKHMMMNDNPYSSHPKGDAGAAKNNGQAKKGYTVIKYKK